jgi:hypothetical protein
MRGRLVRSTLVIVALAGGGAAGAADVCYSGGLILKAFNVPGKGKCKPYQGFFEGSPPQLVNGVACTSSDDTKVYLAQTWVTSNDTPGVGTDRATLDRATLSGIGTECTPASCTALSFTRTNCVPPKQPIP